MIEATCHSDDHAIDLTFDATPWFTRASKEEIQKLADCNWGGDYPADEVAVFMAHRNPDLANLLSYVEVRHPIDGIGFECHVNPESAVAWLKENNPAFQPRLSIED